VTQRYWLVTACNISHNGYYIWTSWIVQHHHGASGHFKCAYRKNESVFPSSFRHVIFSNLLLVCMSSFHWGTHGLNSLASGRVRGLSC